MHTVTIQSISPQLGLTSTEMVLTVVIILISSFFMIYFLAQKRRRSGLAGEIDEARSQELEWHREKRFLMERQAAEKQARLAGLIDSLAQENAHSMTHLASRLFFLAEAIREERQHLGTDLSKLGLIERRLRKLENEGGKQSGNAEDWLAKMKPCLQIIQSNHQDLRKSQNLLRHVLGEVVNLEGEARSNRISESELPAVMATLEGIKNELEELPEGLQTLAKSTAEQAQSLFSELSGHLAKTDVQTVWIEQTNLDLFSSKHRPGGRGDLLDAAEKAINVVNRALVPVKGFSSFWDLPKEVPIPATNNSETILEIDENKETHNIGKSGADLFSNLIGDKSVSETTLKESMLTDSAILEEKETFPSFNPDIGGISVVEPVNHSPEVAKREKVSAALATSPAPSKKPSKQRFNAHAGTGGFIPSSSLVIFRSHSPEIWNTTTRNGENDFAIAVNEIAGEVGWMSIKRMDTGEEVFCEISLRDILSNGDGRSSGFNGSNEYFYGANHLGFFSEECATEVETRFTYGGWGFGHLSASVEDDPEQICGWNGQRIPNGTVFEFTLHEDKPEWVREEQIIS